MATNPLAPQAPIYQPDAQQEQAPAPTFQPEAPPPQEEEYQVAGAGPIKALREIYKKPHVDDVPADKVAPPNPYLRVGDAVYIEDADEAVARQFHDLLDIPEGEAIPLVRPNLAHHNLEEVQKQYIETLHRLYDEQIQRHRRGSKTIDELVFEAQSVGMDEAAIELLNRGVGQAINPEQMARAIWVRLNAATYLDQILKDGTDEELMQALPLIASLEMQAAGAVAEAGRTMSVLAHAGRMGGYDKADRLSTLPELISRHHLDEAGSLDKMSFIRKGLMALPTKRKKLHYVKSLVDKGLDVWAESWINALLSAPPTHMVNVLGNALFGTLQLPERALGGVIGGVRVNLLGRHTSSDRVYLTESLAHLMALQRAIPNGMRAAWRAIRHEEATYGELAKVDTRERRAISSDYLNLNPEGAIGKSVDYLGVLTRFMGSRMLLMEDEFFKGIAHTVEIETQAIRKTLSAIDNGATLEEAALEGAAVLAHQDSASLRAASDAAQTLTFQGDLGPLAASFQNVMAHPLMKIFVPFYKTPTNIIKETMSRTPLAPFLPSGFIKEMKAGGARADMALSRFMLGSGMFATFAYWASGSEGSEIMLTGAGPTDKKAQAAWKRMNLQPFSIAELQEDGTYKSYDYSRLAPLAGIFAMAADYANYAQYEDDPGELEKLFVGGGTALYEQMSTLPMMQGLFEVTEIFGSEYEERGQKLTRFFELAGKQLATVAITSAPVPLTGSLGAAVERTLYPEASLAMPHGTEIEGNAFQRGWYEALARAKSRNPFFSKDVEPKLNLWAQPMMQCENGLWCFISPIRVISERPSPVDEELVRLNLGLSMPRKTQRGIRLSAEQYNELLYTMNDITDPVSGMNMYEIIEDVIVNNREYEEADPLTKIETLRGLKADFQNMALDIMFSSDMNLINKKEIRDERIRETGRNITM